MTLILPLEFHETVVGHCRRKLAGEFLSTESPEKKAYGLVAGTRTGAVLEVGACFPLKKNARSREPFRGQMDYLMQKHAVRSETPLEKRGWVADPDEWNEVGRKCSDLGLMLLGTYHMHRVGWNHDMLRDTPTVLDAILGKKSSMVMFIVSMVNPDSPVIRAFFEGNPELEIPILSRSSG